MRICIIPARGGSKRIPRKNIRPFKGEPVISWSIRAALDSGSFDQVLVSTDDPEIASIAQRYGAMVPCMRPIDLADDYTPAHIAARHMLEWTIANQGEVESWAMVFPTAPLLRASLLREGMDMLASARAVWAVTTLPYPVYQLLRRDKDGSCSCFFPPEKYNMRSQDMPEAFIDTGQFYCFQTGHYLQHGFCISDQVAFIETPRECAVDIDTEEDFLFAEYLFDFSRRNDGD